MDSIIKKTQALKVSPLTSERDLFQTQLIKLQEELLVIREKPNRLKTPPRGLSPRFFGYGTASSESSPKLLNPM